MWRECCLDISAAEKYLFHVLDQGKFLDIYGFNKFVKVLGRFFCGGNTDFKKLVPINVSLFVCLATEIDPLQREREREGEIGRERKRERG